MTEPTWPQVLTQLAGGAMVAIVLICTMQWAEYRVFGNIPIEQKINELQWRIDDLEDAWRHYDHP